MAFGWIIEAPSLAYQAVGWGAFSPDVWGLPRWWNLSQIGELLRARISPMRVLDVCVDGESVVPTENHASIVVIPAGSR
ncbi:MAG: hypothetical protein M2R45_02560 [Verrucomicrobia subdivision 3 bacterium]|nr:hypothetical protein [Limisphaerales bacterium]MCS1414233.1 hypothetical protein [Limisphaerales bacterium]